MSIIYHNWERLVRATLKKEELRELARAHSRDPSLSSISSDFSSRSSFTSPLHDHFPVNSGSPEAPSGPSTPLCSRDESLPIRRSDDGILQLPIAKPILFKELQKATRHFRPDTIVGEGGFGPVFKGWINELTLTAAKPGSGMTVAIKKWNPNGFQGFNEWMTGVSYLLQFRHPNLIKLIAYCNEGKNLLSVYEFMPKGSLDNHLFRRGHQCLSWATRIKVAVGAARGLSFLHDAKKQVIHRSFKTADILLDEEFNAKLSDFDFAKDGPSGDATHVSTRVMGTSGYVAPEYMATGHLSGKCDVYAFGVVLLELLSGRRATDRSTDHKIQNLVDWARPYLSKKKKLYRVMDTKLEGQYPQEGAVIVANLALQCLSHEPKSRPCMAEVLATLEGL
ncbi:Protein kinase 2B [Abeliophyllum distichum]|uniref:Protein kinase 2B n=1 Tax=Abeliophyllum distichum TaxID=126358 RepID=A0ABD1R853_9LAMI